ncbi:lysylphosphatidylglycerol synthase domain-containing protein [Sphaerisporangium sp. TRM90804]|uniref:lysylphosphatidylglycerol synthase domain-containing protein n=1 Tax=Sphaerisporangium sp. TRM90804 TaxID=3031113 RepID=UPI00244C4986|nr:lysylphosphatidylglycerol synthase domain-containing protein [Sphaerisporangium sp. TRM90804]MDH2427109.1 lysylphosphatidylglycerol synthase domain-containing protein [Sphaerisporangium sp. TRM90804]
MRAIRLPRPLARALVAAFTLVVVGAIVLTLSRLDWGVVAVLFARRDAGEMALLLAGALLASMAGLSFGFLAWRVVLLELGPPISEPRVVRVFFVGFLSKYVPGRVPGMIAVTKVAAANGIAFGRLIATAALIMSLVLLSGFTVGLLAGVQLLGAQAGWLAGAAVLIVAVLARPQLINQGSALLLRLMRRPTAAETASVRGVRLAVAWQSLSWVVTGLHVWPLAIAMGAPPVRSLALCVGAFTLATTLGIAALFIPDGIGVREAMLTAALSLVMPPPAAAVVALVSRLVSTVAEILLGAVALTIAELLLRRRRARQQPADEEPSPQTAPPIAGLAHRAD